MRVTVRDSDLCCVCDVRGTVGDSGLCYVCDVRVALSTRVFVVLVTRVTTGDSGLCCCVCDVGVTVGDFVVMFVS